MPEAPFEKHKVHPWKMRGQAANRPGGAEAQGRDNSPPPSSIGACASRHVPSYAELAVTSNFTFLTGASHPEELVQTAAAMGHAFAAVADLHTLAGVVRAHVAAKEAGIGLAVGTRVVLGEWRTGEAAKRPSAERYELDHPVTPPLRRSTALLLFPTDRRSYGNLCRLLTVGKRRAPKGECHLDLHDVLEHQDGLLCVALPPRLEALDDEYLARLEGLARVFRGDDRFSIAACRDYGPDDRSRLEQIDALCAHVGVPMCAVNDVLYHDPGRRALQDVLACIRHGCTIDEAGLRLQPHAERCLKPPDEMARLFAEHPRALARSVEIAGRSATGFSLDMLRYEYADEVVPPGRTAMEHLAELVWAGVEERHEGTEAQRHRVEGTNPDPLCPCASVPLCLRSQILHELRLIEELNYAPYFLTVHDLVRFARSRGILCQGRGAAANSAVCYYLGITSVDPQRIDLLFERFVSRERNEPPDIDIDFEHERREEVIQYIYGKYGRERAALTAEVITYRGRSAIREVGKALGLSLDCVDRLAKQLDWWERGFGEESDAATQRRSDEGTEEKHKWEKEDAHRVRDTWRGDHPRHEPQPSFTNWPLGIPKSSPASSRRRSAASSLSSRLRELGLNPDDPTIRLALRLAGQILGFPRHLSQHVGGFVITRGPLCESVPIENARMPDRTVIEWDKDDIDALGMLKVDVLGLGMLTVIGKALRFVNGRHEGTEARRHTEFSKETYGREEADPNLSRSDRVAEGQGAGQDDLSRHGQDACIRAVRSDQPDETGYGVGALQHRGGVCEAVHGGLSPVSSDGEGLACGAGNAVRTGYRDGHAHAAERTHGTPGGGGPTVAVADHESRRHSGAQGVDASPLCLRASVPLCLWNLPPEDPRVYDMICRADTIGVFQIESRAQMSMLPRLRPRTFYDLVIEVAIVRPGPIVGDMVHPYLKRRNGEEKVEYPDEAVRAVLGKTLGVPLFQEQAMKLAMVAAGFTAGEADQLRRAIAAWKTKQKVIYTFGKRIIEGMTGRGYPREFAERCFEQLKGFSEYGFPESHAASFALLVYASAWLKCYYPAEFAAALINSQPMGFYAPAQIIRDAREHGVEVRPVDVNASGWDCRIDAGDRATERPGDEGPAANDHVCGSCSSSLHGSVASSPAPSVLRLGFRLVCGLAESEARLIEQVVAARGPFTSITALRRATGVRVATLRRLAHADAFGSMGLDRQRALWEVRALRDESLPLFDAAGAETRPVRRRADLSLDPSASPPLPPISPLRHVIHDYDATGLSLKAHPVSFMREQLAARRVTTNASLRDQDAWKHGSAVAVCGIVLVRQRPSTASGVVFMTIEDETGAANLILWPRVYQKFRRAARHSVIVIARGRVQRDGEVVHVLVRSIADAGESLAGIESMSRDFR